MKKQTFYPPLRDEFTKFGDKFVKIAHNEANGMYCYKRTTSDALTYYEVFKAPEAKAPEKPDFLPPRANRDPVS
jgi:hypothetical protein